MTLPPGAGAGRRLVDLPFRRGLPLLGNALDLDPKRFHLIFEEWSRELGEVFTITIGTRKVLIDADAEHMQSALRNRPEGFRRLSMMRRVAEEMGWNGVLTAEGPAWRAVQVVLEAPGLRA
jgi:hypothetical protein